MASVFVEIPVEGNWPSRDDLEARNAVMNVLTSARIGEFVGAGGGLGSMDFQFQVDDVQFAKDAIAKAIEIHLPGRECEIRVCE